MGLHLSIVRTGAVTAAAATLARSLASSSIRGASAGAHLLYSLINWPKVHTIGILHQLTAGEQRTTVNFLPTAAAATTYTTIVSAADDAAAAAGASRQALGRRCQTALNDSTYVYVRRSPVRPQNRVIGCVRLLSAQRDQHTNRTAMIDYVWSIYRYMTAGFLDADGSFNHSCCCCCCCAVHLSLLRVLLTSMEQ